MIGSYLGGLLSSTVQVGGDASRWMVELGDGEVLGRSVELGGTGRSLEVNEDAGRA